MNLWQTKIQNYKFVKTIHYKNSVIFLFLPVFYSTQFYKAVKITAISYKLFHKSVLKVSNTVCCFGLKVN